MEVYFLAPRVVSQLEKSLKEFAQYPIVSSSVELTQKYDCTPMGDGCFHPQLGFIKEHADSLTKEEFEKKKTEKTLKQLKTINSMDVNVIDCKDGNYFDIFCGKAKKDLAPAGDMEVWIDTSSSMKRVDFNGDEDHCLRRSFAEKLIHSCPKAKLSISVFNTSKKMLGGHDTLCLNYGLNDEKRLMRWIENSRAKHLVIVTDVDELSPSLRTFLDNNGAIMHGGDYANFDGEKLIKASSELINSCKSL